MRGQDAEGAPAGARRPPRGPAHLARAEDGSLVVFGLLILVVMLMAAGLAIDTMRHERERVRLQATLDRAVLAAADLGHTLPPEQVVESYFEAAGLSDRLGAVSVERSLNHKSVTAQAAYDMPTVLLGMAGVDSLRAASLARAEERVTDVEISLVLDVSGSMARFDRLTNLRRAATEFIDEVLPADAPPGERGLTTVSLVPYSSSVNAGRALLAHYGLNRVHEWSNCVLFQNAITMRWRSRRRGASPSTSISTPAPAAMPAPIPTRSRRRFARARR